MEYGLGELLTCVVKMLAAILIGRLPFPIEIPAGVIFTIVLELAQAKNNRLRVAMNLCCGTRGLTLPKSWFGGKFPLGTNSVPCALLAWYCKLGLLLTLFNLIAELLKFLASDIKKALQTEEGRELWNRWGKDSRRLAILVILEFALTAQICIAEASDGKRRENANAFAGIDKHASDVWRATFDAAAGKIFPDAAFSR